MTELRQAAQAVLDRWDSPQWAWRQHGPTADLMADLRAALAQPPAPHRYSPLGMASCGKPLCSDREHHPLCQMAQPPAPTAQPAAEADDAEKASFYAMFGAAEKATGHKPSHYDVWLMARGLMTADGRSAQPVQQPGAEPDGRLHADGYFTWKRRDGYVLDAKLPCDFYLAAPAQRQPLSEARLIVLGPKNWAAADCIEFGRAIEAAHGITAAPAAQKGENP